MRPFVSIIIPTHNNARTLSLVLMQVEKYLKHRQKDFEIIVADRGSRDATREIIRRFEVLVPELQPIYLEEETTTGEAVKMGLTTARGAWRAILSAEDTAHIDELEKALPHLQKGFDLAVGRESGLQLSKKLYRLLYNLIVPSEEKRICFISSDTAASLLPQAKTLSGRWLLEMLKLSKQQGLKIKKFPVYYNT